MKLRRTLAALTAAVMLAASAAMPASAAGSPGSGDADCNGSVNIADGVLIARFLAEDTEISMTTQGRANADLNGDGLHNTEDLTLLLEELAGLRKTQPGGFLSVNLLADKTLGGGSAAAPDDAFTAAQYAFSANLLRTVCAENSGLSQNVLVSPLSVSLALGMTANGAKGQTLSEMEQVLGQGLTVDKLNAYYNGWSQALAKSSDTEETTLDIANAVWFRDDKSRISPPDSFLQTIADFYSPGKYNAGIYRAPFDDTTLSDVNGWVKEHTHEMIPKILEEINPNSVMYLVNALAFEGTWAEPYYQGDLRSDLFYSADGSPRTADYLCGKEYTYLDDGKAVGFVKPFWGRKFSFAAVLPDAGTALDDYIAGLDGKALKKLLDSAQSAAVRSRMPKFSFSFGNSLVETLKNMGMPTAFSDDADFTGMNSADNQILIGNVIHKTFIEVSETGVRAAAATLVDMMDKAITIEDWKDVVLNRPFLIMILDNETGLPVFIGAVRDIGEPVPEPVPVPDTQAEK